MYAAAGDRTHRTTAGIIRATEARVGRILQSKWNAVLLVAEALEHRGCLIGDDVQRLVERADQMMEAQATAATVRQKLMAMIEAHRSTPPATIEQIRAVVAEKRGAALLEAWHNEQSRPAPAVPRIIVNVPLQGPVKKTIKYDSQGRPIEIIERPLA
jgi:hypothetical protein